MAVSPRAARRLRAESFVLRHARGWASLRCHVEEDTMAKSGVTYVNPPSAPPPQGMYSHVARMQPGEIAFIAGQVAIDAKGNPIGVGDFAAQVGPVFENLGKILGDLGTDFEGVVQFTTFMTSADYIPIWMKERSALFPRLFLAASIHPTRCW